MSSVLASEMQAIVRSAAAPVLPGDSVKAQLRRAHQCLGQPKFWRVRAAWHGEAGSWSGDAVSEFRERFMRIKKPSQQALHDMQAATLEAIALKLETMNAAIHGAEIARLRDMAVVLRNLS